MRHISRYECLDVRDVTTYKEGLDTAILARCMTTLGIDSCKSPAKLRLEDLRIGRFCGVKELTLSVTNLKLYYI